jgi:hypothetical protein
MDSERIAGPTSGPPPHRPTVKRWPRRSLHSDQSHRRLPVCLCARGHSLGMVILIHHTSRYVRSNIINESYMSENHSILDTSGSICNGGESKAHGPYFVKQNPSSYRVGRRCIIKIHSKTPRSASAVEAARRAAHKAVERGVDIRVAGSKSLSRTLVCKRPT